MTHEARKPADLHLHLEPERREDGRVAFDVEGLGLTLTPRGSGWDYERPGLGRTIHVADVAGELPRFHVRVPSDEAVARFANPVFVPGSDAIDLWVAWPLEVVVTVGDGVELDRVLPGRRKTLFGTVSEGRVLPAAICAVLSGPADPAVAHRPVAALYIRVRNRTAEPASVSRVPVFGTALTLHRRDASFAATGVRTEISGDGHASALTKPGDAPSGYTRVAAGRAVDQSSHLGWLLEATKRSVEFPL